MSLPQFKKISIDQYKPGKSGSSRSIKIYKLSANESALGPSPRAIKAYLKNKNFLNKYPDNKFNNLKHEIAKTNRIDSNKIICGSGSDEVIQMICQLFLKDKDEVVMSRYSFIMYKIYSELKGAKVRFANEENYTASVKEIIKKINKKTKIVFLANPNNPTGTYLNKNDVLSLRKKIRSNILLVLDDAYCEYMNNKDYKSGLELFKNSKNVIVLRTFSKIYGLAGLRIGWGYGPKRIIDEMYKVKPPFNVNKAAIVAATEAIKDKNWIKRSNKNNFYWAKRIYNNLKELNINLNKPTANFFLLRFDKTKKNANQINKILIKKGLILRQMQTYNIPNALRFTIGRSKENIKFIKEISKILKNV